MKVGLHDAEFDHMPLKTFPNLALMKISAWHKAQGDTVEWWNPLCGPSYGKVYSSKVFDFTPEHPYLPEGAAKGGTGYGMYTWLPPEVDGMTCDYSLYPHCDYAVGFLTRGCPNHCTWCVVPRKEGGIRPYADWREVVRGDTDKLVLMDNNILASGYGIDQLDQLAATDYRIDLNQGMDARLVGPGIADIIARAHWLRWIRFSCDSHGQIDAIARAANLLKERGVAGHKLFIYLLVTTDIGDAAFRVEQLVRAVPSISIYAQMYRGSGAVHTREQREFCQRYVYGGSYRKETWAAYCKRIGIKKEEANGDY